MTKGAFGFIPNAPFLLYYSVNRILYSYLIFMIVIGKLIIQEL